MRTVVFVVFPDFMLLDLAGPLDVLRTATLLGADPPYRAVVASADGNPVRSESGLLAGADAALTDLADSDETVDTVVVVGGLGVRAAARDASFLRSLRALSAKAERTASVCTGALALAAAGLLDGYRATTHWSSCDRLAQQHPEIDVLEDRLHVHDRDRWTSAGVTAGIDLFLALVEADHGPELAHQVAGWLVVFARRPGGQAQFSAQLKAQAARTPGIAALQRWLPDHLTEDLTVEYLAQWASMSPRTFARVFTAETGTTPAAYVEALRIEAAQRLLATTDLTVTAVAQSIGIGRIETFHRAFRRRTGTTPDRYRQHFGSLSA